MRFSVRLAAITAVCTLPATIALAQGQESGTSGNMGDRSPDQVTCADITAMDTRLVPGVLYYIAGYQEGSRAGMAGAGGGQAAGGAESTSGTTSSASGSDTAMSGTDPSSTGGSPATASNGNAASPSSDAAGAATGGSGATSGGSMNVVRVTGMFEIPVEQVMVVCGQSPDMKASDAVEQNRGSGASTN